METNDFHTADLRRVKLQPLQPSDLPTHPAILPESGVVSPDLVAFITEALTEAVKLSDNLVPTIFQKKGNPKATPHSTAEVQILATEVIKNEAWFARSSRHEDAAKDGTATYQEMEDGLFHDHNLNEMNYTPDMYDAYKVLDWSEQIAGKSFGDFTDVAMEMFEMGHKLPAPLDRRVFSVVVVRGKDGAKSFVDTQLPVDISTLPSAFYSNGRHLTEGDNAAKRAKIIIGQYVSVERVKVLEEGSDAGKVLWLMGTASDTKGWLPMGLQKMGLPGAIVKDVGMFMKWKGESRKGTAS